MSNFNLGLFNAYKIVFHRITNKIKTMNVTQITTIKNGFKYVIRLFIIVRCLPLDMNYLPKFSPIPLDYESAVERKRTSILLFLQCANLSIIGII